MQELSVVIPSAGMGKRMKSYGPKPLIELSEKYTVVGRQQHLIKKEFPSSEIIVVVGHEADAVIKKLGPTVKPVENEFYETTNVVRSIGMGLRIASHPHLLLIYGDLVFNTAAIKITGGPSVAVVDTKQQIDDDEVGVTIVDGRVTQFSYDLETKWAQIVYLTGRELELFKHIVWNRNNDRWFGFEALNAVVNKGGNIRAVEPRNMNIAEIDSSQDILKARKIT